jgi:hypothetical protein
MNRKHLSGALLIAASLLASGAYAQNPNPTTATPGAPAKAADKAEKAGDKAEKKAEKAADKVEKAGEKLADKAKGVEDRAARKAKEHDAQREKLKGMLKTPVNEAMRQELRRHAERTAKLERIKSLAEADKDKETVEKTTKLLAKENERHDKWMEKNASTASTTAVPAHTGATPAAVPAAPAAPAATDGKDSKGGAK